MNKANMMMHEFCKNESVHIMNNIKVEKDKVIATDSNIFGILTILEANQISLPENSVVSSDGYIPKEVAKNFKFLKQKKSLVDRLDHVIMLEKNDTTKILYNTNLETAINLNVSQPEGKYPDYEVVKKDNTTEKEETVYSSIDITYLEKIIKVVKGMNAKIIEIGIPKINCNAKDDKPLQFRAKNIEGQTLDVLLMPIV